MTKKEAIKAILDLKEYCGNHEDCEHCPLHDAMYRDTCAMSASVSGIPALWDTRAYDKEVSK